MSRSAPASRTDVAVVPWPAERSLRFELAVQRVPRLLLIPAEADPPELIDDLEDWVRAGIRPADLAARSRSLARRAGHGGGGPVLDHDGLLRVGDRWTPVPDGQAAVVGLLIERMDRVVPRVELAATYRAGGGSDHPDSIRTLTGRLAGRFREVGLDLVTIRTRGVMLTSTAAAGP